MSGIGRFLHPRRLWLWSTKRVEIKANAQQMLPTSYELDKLIREHRTDVEQLKAAGVLEYKTQLSRHSTSPQHNDNNIQNEAVLGAAEGALLYGHGVLDQLRTFDGQFAHALAQGMRDTLLNSSNLNFALTQVANLTQSRIPSAFLPLAQPIINHCVQNAETWCNENLLAANNHAAVVTNLAQSANDLHGEILSAAGGGMHDAWLNPSGSVTSHPMDVMATHFENADSVDTAGDLLGHGSDAIEHVADHASGGLHVPWFTIIRSGHREFKLLQSGKTDGVAASKNMAIDTGAMLAGAKAGAIVGSFLGPIGAAIGGALGGIGGKLFGNELKQGDLKAAVAVYEQHTKRLAETQQEIEQRITTQFNVAKSDEQKQLTTDANQLVDEVIKSAKLFNDWVQSRGSLSSPDAKPFLAGALIEIEDCINKLNQHLSNMTAVESILWPSIQFEAIQLATSIAVSQRKMLETLAAKTMANGNIKVTELLQLLSNFGVSENLVRGLFKSNEIERKQRDDSFQKLLQKNQKIIFGKRIEAINRLDILLKKLAPEVEETIEPMVKQLNDFGNRVVREKQKLGLA